MKANGGVDDSIVLVETFGKRQTAGKKNFDGERNLSMFCNELRYPRLFLMVVGQWYPESWSSTKKNLYHVWQLILTIGVWSYYAYSFGCFGVMTLERQHFKWFPITSVEDVVWESRWVISHHLGLYYFCRQRHLEKFLEESCLTRTLWRDTVRYLKRICLAAIFLVILMPVLLHPAEIYYSVEPDDGWKIVLDTFLLALDRLVTTPIFLAFVLEAYILVRVVKGYGECIKIWPKNYKNIEGSGMRSAKLRFREIKSLISSVENAYQLYLSLHFFSLLVTAFLGVFACAEQLEGKVNEIHGYWKVRAPRYYNRMNIKSAMTMFPAVKTVRPQSGNSNLSALLPSEVLTRKQVNVTLTKQVADTYTEEGKQQLLVEVGIEAVLKILESVVLYLVPLTLMLRLQTKLRLVRQAIVDSDCFEQEQNGYLFQDDQSIRTMEHYVGTCTGIKIFGYKMPLFRGFLLSVGAPFLTALTTLLFAYIRIKK